MRLQKHKMGSDDFWATDDELEAAAYGFIWGSSKQANFSQVQPIKLGPLKKKISGKCQVKKNYLANKKNLPIN